MARRIPVKRTVKWNSALHPRDIYGKFRKVHLVPGETIDSKALFTGPNGEATGRVYDRYNTDKSLLSPGTSLLKVAAVGPTFTSVKDGDVLARIHLTQDEDGNLLSIAGSEGRTFLVIDHNKDGFEDPHSLSRGSMYQPLPENLAEGETSWGGRAAAGSGRTDGKVYNTLNAQKTIDATKRAFEAEGAQSFSIDPGELADKVADVRKAYEKLGMSNSEARRAPVYVYVDGKGRSHVEPALKIGDNGRLVKAHAPNSHGGTGTVKLRGDEVTRMARSMQDEGLDSVEVAVTQGTTGRTNALYFRADYVNPTDHHEISMMGVMEQRTASHSVEEARSAVANPDGTMNFEKRREIKTKQARRHREEAEPYRHPKTAEDAATFYRKLHGKTVNAPGTPELLEGDKFTFRSGSGYDPVFSGDTGRLVGVNISSTQGAAYHAMTIRQGQPLPQPEQISVRHGRKRKTKQDIPDVYTVRWYDGHVDRFTADGQPYTSDDMFD